MNREINNNNNNNNNMSSSGDIIDLCASSSEDEEDEDQVQIVLPATTRVVAHKQRNDAATLKNIVVTPDQVKQNDDNISSSSSSSEGRHSKPKRPRSLFPTTKNKPPSRNDDCSSSDSDSDDPLLSFQAFKPVKSVPKQAADPFPITTSTSTSTLRSKQPPSLKTKNPTSTKNSKPNTSTRKMETGSWTSETPRIHNPYKIKQFKQPTIYSSICGSAPSPNFPDLGSAHYEDVRAKYILAFWKYAQSLEHASFNLGRLDQFCKRINALALSEYPIRSLEEYCFRFTKGSTMETTHNLLEALQAGNVDNYNAHPFGSNDGRYYSIAEACLESMLSHVELIASSFGYPNPSTLPDSQVQTLLKEKACWVFLNDLIPKIDDKLQPICPGRLTRHNDDDNGASFYLDPSTRSTEFKQLERLQRTPSGEDLPYIKAHKQRGETCYELTTLGFQTAVRVRSRTFPAAPGPYRTSNLPTPCDGICLVVDTREGGGPQNKLHQMCNKLDSLKIPYMVCRLKIGDYCFMTSDGKMFPILVERKSIQDVAQSIYDGRWTNQKLNMYQGQFVFGYEHSRMLYVIEGKESTQQLTGGYIGQRHLNVTRDQLDQAVHNLQEEGFEVLRTHTSDHSMVELARVATLLLQDLQGGKIQAQYTLQEFLSQVQSIPKSTDFSRIAKDMAETRRRLSQKEEGNQQKLDPAKAENNKPAALGKPGAIVGKPKKVDQENNKDHQFQGWSVAQLQKQCAEWGLQKSGKKADLIQRLKGPRPPQLWLERKKRDVGYVPTRHNTCATALLVALYLEQRQHQDDTTGSSWQGTPKEELYPIAEALNISKDPFSGIASSGPFQYDGWSSMSDLKSGELPLVVLKRGRFRLTTSSEVSGFQLAEAMHQWCHAHKNCSCQQLGYDHCIDDG